MDFQVVILAGGISKNLAPIVSTEVPKPLLPVGNRHVLSYILQLLEASNFKDLIVVVEDKEAALSVGGWISSTYVDPLHAEVLSDIGAEFEKESLICVIYAGETTIRGSE